jgi:hypothetical protein
MIWFKRIFDSKSDQKQKIVTQGEGGGVGKEQKNLKCFLNDPLAEFQHRVYTCRKCMHFQSKLGQTKVVFDNQGKNPLQSIAFTIGIFLFKI